VRHTKGNHKVHMCMFHGRCYNHKGEHINVTDEAEGSYPAGFDRKHLGLPPVAKLESYRGFIWVSLNPDVPPLKEYLNGSTTFIDLLVDQSPTGELEVLPGETTYIYQGNWKLQAENGLDGYHLPTTHANYFMTVGRRAKGLSGNTTKTVNPSGIFNGSGFLAFKYGHGLIYFNYPNPQVRPGYEMREGHLERHGELRTQWMIEKTRNLLIMPNVFLMDQASTQIRVFRPLAVDRTEVTTYCIAPKGESAESREHRLRQYEDFFNASGMATPDDIAEFRNCQIGYQAKAAPFSEFSRGHSRWINGTNEQGKQLGVEAQMSSTHGADEGLYVNILGEWAQCMQRIVKGEIERAAREC
ncbi:MAG: aromatic ring-hydroxylating dioxygenase subunit alpha, partial [Rugosibacter sp.]|nr:aromatic ring-hydroxylating dioxygenase subunit alpha [Rugosibacter sp.]